MSSSSSLTLSSYLVHPTHKNYNQSLKRNEKRQTILIKENATKKSTRKVLIKKYKARQDQKKQKNKKKEST